MGRGGGKGGEAVRAAHLCRRGEGEGERTGQDEDHGSSNGRIVIGMGKGRPEDPAEQDD